ncbi:MAG: hypothetical protein Kow00120_16560 [Anaerolineae bacterium]
MTGLSVEAVLILIVMLATLSAFVVATILYTREMARQRQAMRHIRDEIRAAVMAALDQQRRALLDDVQVEEAQVMPLLAQAALDATGARLEVRDVLAVRDAPVPALVAAATDGDGDLEVVYTPNGEAYIAHVLAPARRANGAQAYSVSPANSSLVIDEALRQAWRALAARYGIPEARRTLPQAPVWDVVIVPGRNGGGA